MPEHDAIETDYFRFNLKRIRSTAVLIGNVFDGGNNQVTLFVKGILLDTLRQLLQKVDGWKPILGFRTFQNSRQNDWNLP